MGRHSVETSQPLAHVAIAASLAVLAAGCLSSSPGAERLTLATTTSVSDSGLLSFILPDFEAQNNARVAVVAVGSGQALEIGKRGDADVLIVHSPSAEQAFVSNGSGVARWQIMYNYFAIAGPDTDPAGVRNSSNASDAFTRVASNASVFISRGDASGTHSKELALWAGLGLNTSSFGPWYKSIGQGMAAALRTAYELDGYTLTDEGTYWSIPDVGPNATAKPGLHLLLGGLADPAPDLKNTYSVIELNATRTPTIRADLAHAFALWITSNETADRIATYTVGGHQLFFPEPRRT